MARHMEYQDELPQEDWTKREGPFEITKVIGPVTYRLKLPATWKIHPVFHTTLLRQYKETDVYGMNFPRPPPDLVKGEEVYEVERILKHRRRGWGYQYYVAWKGYPITEASWEPEHIFSDDATSSLGINLTTTYEYPCGDRIALIDVRKYDDGVDVEIG